MEGDSINGQANSPISMKDNLWKGREMEEEHFGGLMEVGTRDNSETESRVGMVFFIVKEDTENMKDLGIMECLMGREFNILKTDKNTKEPLKRINSMEKESSTKMTQLFMVSGKIMSFQWLIW